MMIVANIAFYRVLVLVLVYLMLTVAGSPANLIVITVEARITAAFVTNAMNDAVRKVLANAAFLHRRVVNINELARRVLRIAMMAVDVMRPLAAVRQLTVNLERSRRFAIDLVQNRHAAAVLLATSVQQTRAVAQARLVIALRSNVKIVIARMAVGTVTTLAAALVVHADTDTTLALDAM